MNKRNCLKLPSYYGIFIVLALLPQIFGINGSIIEDGFKVFLIAVLLLKTLHFDRSLSYFTQLYMAGIIASSMLTVLFDVSFGLADFFKCGLSIMILLLFVAPITWDDSISKHDILNFYKIYAYFMIAAAIYNMVIHYSSLLRITSLSVYSAEEICSFFDNKNTFGVFLIFGVLSSATLKIMTNQKKWHFFSIIFLLNEVMAMCRTAVVISFMIILFSFYFNSKNNAVKNILSLLLIMSIIVLLLSNQSINRFIFDNMFSSTDSLDTRNSYAENLLPLLKNKHLFFGYGNKTALELASVYTGNRYYHNGFLKSLMIGGIFNLSLQIWAILMSFYYGFKNFKIDKQIGSICLISSVTYIIYNFVESVVLFDTPVVAIISVLFVITMPIMFNNVIKTEKRMKCCDL